MGQRLPEEPARKAFPQLGEVEEASLPQGGVDLIWQVGSTTFRPIQEVSAETPSTSAAPRADVAAGAEAMQTEDLDMSGDVVMKGVQSPTPVEEAALLQESESEHPDSSDEGAASSRTREVYMVNCWI